MKRILSILIILCLVSGCASTGGRSVVGFGDALGHGMQLKQGAALSRSMSTFGLGFGILEGVLFGLAAIKGSGGDYSDDEMDAEVSSGFVNVSAPEDAGKVEIAVSDSEAVQIESQKAWSEEGVEIGAEGAGKEHHGSEAI